MAGDSKPRTPLVDVDLESDLGEDGFVDFFQHRGEDAEDGGAGFGVLAGENAQKGLALRLVSALVDDERCFAVAFVDRSRPTKHARDVKPIKLCGAVIACLDLDTDHGAAVTMRRQAVELTRAAIRAV